MPFILGLLLAYFPAVAPAVPPDAAEIVARSVAVLQRDWRAAPDYSFVEHDVEIKSGKRTARRSAAIMIEGSPYWMLLGEDDRPLAADRLRREQKNLDKELQSRRRESEAARRQRIAGYEKERAQDHALLAEMAQALDFKLVGEETLRGHAVYVLDAAPKPGYQPKSLQTRVLTGMRGRLWVERRSYQWAKVEAEVSRPVAFGFFIAKVEPGTRFTLEQAPVNASIWLPSRFAMSVNASVLWWRRTSSEDENFASYQPSGTAIAFFSESSLSAGQ